MDSSLTKFLPDTATVSPEGILHISGHSLKKLAETYATPQYVFDQATIRNACKLYQQAFHEHYHASPVHIIYASKAYLSPLIAQLVTEQGMGLDVVSGGELMLAQRAGFPMERISFHGNNKSLDELRLALQLGVGRIVIDNWSELEHLTLLARENGCRPNVLVRVAPDVDTDTHRYLQTGHAASKFGFPLATGEARAAVLRILQDGQLRLSGLHAHSGTMLRETRPYIECMRRLIALARDVYAETQWWPREISPGGGWAIDEPDQPSTPGIEVLAQSLQATMEQELASERDIFPAPALIIEPGRSIIGRAGVAVYRIGARKSTPKGVTYLFVDGGMADNIRPALYGARYTALAVEQAFAPAEEAVCISGRYCESGDVLIDQVMLPYMHENELLALPGVGAYCLPMGSNYNLVPRPIVLLVDVHSVQVMERRETFDDLLLRYQQA
jgi:diaminopimelate decarboxylase